MASLGVNMVNEDREKKLRALERFQTDAGYMMRWMHLLMGWVARVRARRKSISARYVIDNYESRECLFRLVYKSDAACIEELRMDRATFFRLCEMLKTVARLQDTTNMLVDEQVAIFLHVLAHHVKNRTMKKRFGRSAETINRTFRRVLRAVTQLSGHLLAKPVPIPENSTNERWKWFKNCLGALDETHIRARVPLEDKPRYRNRKTDITINVLGVCSPDMQFIYVLPGWEGSTADGRVLCNAIIRQNGLQIPRGQYYLVDAGYTNGPEFLAPYRGQRYHLNDWRAGHQPSNPKEFFNLKHSSARNVIERCFGLLKQRWAILRSASFYPVSVHNKVIIACCLLHNYIMKEMPQSPIDEDVNAVAAGVPDNMIRNVETSDQWTAWRDELAQNMYNAWMAGRQGGA